LPGFGLDIDRAEDLAAFAKLRSNTCTQAYVDRHSLVDCPMTSGGQVDARK
jgi:hypothetical protein